MRGIPQVPEIGQKFWRLTAIRPTEGVSRGAFQRRIDLGWPHEKAVTEPLRPGKALKKQGLKMRLIGLDVETTGLEQERGHRIIEIAMLTYDMNSRQLEDVWVKRIDPERPIDPKAQEVHGIAYSDLVGCPKWEDLAQEVSDRMSKADLLIAHNMGFDGPFIGAELIRVGVRVPDVHALCTMENARWACPDGKLPKLEELCFALGVDYDHAKAHSAEYDAGVMVECFFRGFDRGFYELPKELRKMDGFKNCHDQELKAA